MRSRAAQPANPATHATASQQRRRREACVAREERNDIFTRSCVEVGGPYRFPALTSGRLPPLEFEGSRSRPHTLDDPEARRRSTAGAKPDGGLGAAGFRQRGREPARNPGSDVPGPRTARIRASAIRAARTIMSGSSGTMVISARRRRCEADHTVRDRAGLRDTGCAPSRDAVPTRVVSPWWRWAGPQPCCQMRFWILRVQVRWHRTPLGGHPKTGHADVDRLRSRDDRRTMAAAAGSQPTSECVRAVSRVDRAGGVAPDVCPLCREDQGIPPRSRSPIQVFTMADLRAHEGPKRTPRTLPGPLGSVFIVSEQALTMSVARHPSDTLWRICSVYTLERIL